jgi:hypothetical protein
MSDTLIESETLRVRVVPDMDPSEPYNDGGSPIVRLDWSFRWEAWTVEQITAITSYELPEEILDTIGKHLNENGAGVDTLTLALEPHGITTVVSYNSGIYTYVTFDPPDWREQMGLTDEYLAAHPEVKPASLDEYRAYIEGECYGYVLEELVTWTRDSARSYAPEERTRETWEELDSCWGFYGSEYIEEEARRVFTEACGERGHDSGDNPVDENGESTCTMCGAPVNADPDAS